jgi:methionyl-tRNA formyltransferase
MGTPAFVKGKPHYAFLALREHPYATWMLKTLVDAGFKPAVVIEEDDGKIAEIERIKFEKRCAGHELAESIQDQCNKHGIERVTVKHHNFSGCFKVLTQYQPRLLVLGGTRIIRDPILTFPVDGIIGVHPGYLPDCRGSSSPAWSVLYDIPIASSGYLCEAGIDTGPLLKAPGIVQVKKGDTYEDLCYYTLRMSSTLMAEIVAVYAEHGKFDSIATPQGKSLYPCFECIPDDQLPDVAKKLTDGTYKHMVPDADMEDGSRYGRTN